MSARFAPERSRRKGDEADRQHEREEEDGVGITYSHL